MKKIQEIFGSNLRLLREHAGISQETLAEMSGLHRTYISGIERGNRNPSLVNIAKIAKALNIPIDKLFMEEL